MSYVVRIKPEWILISQVFHGPIWIRSHILFCTDESERQMLVFFFYFWKKIEKSGSNWIGSQNLTEST